MEQNAICKYCGKKFQKDSTLLSHVCVKKQRYLDVNTAGSRFGLRAFQRFYELTSHTKKIKTLDEFINSSYYIDFVKFGNHLELLRPLYIERYIDFVLTNGVKLKDWTKDFVYDTYIIDLIKKEPAESATERSISTILAWCDTNTIEFSNFFNSISSNEAAYLIKMGKISPWVLYLAPSADALMSKFNEDHSKLIGPIIEPGFWMKKFRKSKEDVDYIGSLLDQSGL
jgi:hypothetical protein